MATWKSIWTICSDELVRLLLPATVSWHELARSAAPAEAIEQDFALGDLPHLTEVASAIDAWAIDGHWPNVSDGARHCIRLRLNAAATFVYLLFDTGQSTQFLYPPEGYSERQIVRWLLTAWWERHGRSFLARQICEIHEEPEDEPDPQ